MVYGQPVAGLSDPGPVVPRHPPSTLEQITKYMFVSNALPGPIMLSHQPGLPVAESGRESLSTVYLMAGRRCSLEGRMGGVSEWEMICVGQWTSEDGRFEAELSNSVVSTITSGRAFDSQVTSV
jgi:hypothetical protein